jgi:hypothetical protein
VFDFVVGCGEERRGVDGPCDGQVVHGGGVQDPPADHDARCPAGGVAGVRRAIQWA